MPLKRVVDLLMTVLLLLLMALQVTGETAHEWLGMGMSAVWRVWSFICPSVHSFKEYVLGTCMC